MGQQFDQIKDKHKEFVAKQKLFFVGTATEDSRINISPKGLDSLRILAPNRVIWLNVTGSGNETAAHVQANPRMTLMFCAFEGAPIILRFYGSAKAVHHNDSQWAELYQHFPNTPGARQIFDLNVELVQSSCGMAVPYFDFAGERTLLNEWADKKGSDGLQEYWEKKNQSSIDGIESHIMTKNT